MKYSNEPRKLSEEGLNQHIDAELAETIGFYQSGDRVSTQRLDNLKYYYNLPLGDEVKGRSQLQDSTVQDVVEALMPDMTAPFISADQVVEFDPEGEEDEDFAEKAANYINHIFMKDNDGLAIQYTWLKDALLQKNGFVYADWCEKSRVKTYQQRVSFQDLATITEEEGVEILEAAAFDESGDAIDPELVEAAGFDPEAISALYAQNGIMLDPMAISYEISYRREWKEGRVKVCNIPPEYFVVSDTATTIEDAGIVGWYERVSITQLREEGYSEEDIARIPADDGNRADVNSERTIRELDQGGETTDGSQGATEESARKVWRTVVWTRVDTDGDGKAELRKIIRAGAETNGGIILLNEEADFVPIVSYTPIPMPHQLFGRCPADQAFEVQKAKTALVRASMDGVYFSIDPRYMIFEDGMSEDTIDDLMNGVPGAPIRAMSPGAVQQLNDTTDLGSAFQMLEYFDRVRESRTPVSRQDQGMSADVLNDKTAREATIQANASARRKELMLRLYAEALGSLFSMILKIVVKNQDRPRQMRLMGEYMEVDPRFWNTEMDVTVSVGLGTGTKDQQLSTLFAILSEQKEAMAGGSKLVDEPKLYNTLSRIVEYSGMTSPELYFNDPDQEEEEGQPPEDTEAMQQQEAQAIEQAINDAYEAGKEEGTNQMKMAEIQSKERMHAIDAQIDQQEVDVKAAEAAAKQNPLMY